MFDQIFSQKKTQLIPFLMAGHPDIETTERLACALVEEGIEILELGVPFSDPMADGPVIQKASELALSNGTNLSAVLKLAERIHLKSAKLQIVIFSYFNPLLAFGLDRYAREAKQAGVAATLCVDLPPEEATLFLDCHFRHGLKNVFLASPTTSSQRLSLINECSSAFVYYVSRAGVTGEQKNLSPSLAGEIATLRKSVSRPVAVGFGISDSIQAEQVSRFADGVVIGSALTRLITDSSSKVQGEERVREFMRSCIRAMKS